MRVILDTHLYLWAVSTPSKLSTVARKLIDEAEVFVSAASIWEIAIKAGIGKLTADVSQLLANIEPTGFSLLNVTGEHAAQVALLPSVHRDPFDRMLVAQALTEPMILLTNDELVGRYGSIVRVV